MTGLLGGLAALITTTIAAGGYWGVALMMAIESACIPLPSEIIMPFAGYLVSTGRFSLPLVATAGALGCNLGSAIAYAVGRFGGRPAILRYGRWVLLSPAELHHVDRFFLRFGGVAVLIGRLLPVIRTFVALPAGIARMPQLRFHLYTFVGSWAWCFALAWIGDVLGTRWDHDPAFARAMHRGDAAVVVLLLLGFVAFLWVRMRKARGAAP